MKKIIIALVILFAIVSLVVFYTSIQKTEVATAACGGTETDTYVDYDCERNVGPQGNYYSCEEGTGSFTGSCSLQSPPGGPGEACGFFGYGDETCTPTSTGCIFGGLIANFHFCSTDGDDGGGGDGDGSGTCASYPGGIGQACNPNIGCYCKGTDDTTCTNLSGPGTCQYNVTVDVTGPSSSPACKDFTISWASTHADTCKAVYGTLSDFWPSGETLVLKNWHRTGQEDNVPNPPPFTRTYGVQCSNEVSTKTDSQAVNILALGLCNPPTCSPPSTTAETGQNVTFTGSSGGGGPYDWSGGGAPASAQNTSSFTTKWLVPGTYTVTVTSDANNKSNTCTATVTGPQNVTVDLDANGSDGPITINYNTGATLGWTTTGNPATCTASGGWSGSKSTSGGSEGTGNLTLSKSYTLSCSNATSSDSDSVTVNVTPQNSCTVDLTVSPTTVSSGGSATLSWNTTNAASCTASGSWSGSKSVPAGSQSTGPLTTSQGYALNCASAAGNPCSDTANVTVSGLLTPNADIAANPTTIPYNTASMISWTSSNVDSCTVSPTGWTGTSGNYSSGNLTSSQTYTLNCTGPSGAASDAVTVNVQEMPQNLTASLNANPPSGEAPLDTTLIATAGGTATGSINYTFWKDCNNGIKDVAQATQVCGNPDAKYDGTNANPQSDPADYPDVGSYVAKVIIERGSFSAEARTSVNVTSAPEEMLTASLEANPPSGAAPLNTTLIATAGGTTTGSINYTFWKNCNNPTVSVTGATQVCGSWDAKFDGVNSNSQSAGVTYSSQGDYTAKVIIERGSLAEEARRGITVSVGDDGLSPPTVDIDAYPTVIYQGGLSTLTWSAAGAETCSASANPGSPEWSGSKPTSGQQIVTPPGTTTYTLTCQNETGPASDSVTVIAPSIREILPTP